MNETTACNPVRVFSKKPLARVLVKLGVETRTAAAGMAMSRVWQLDLQFEALLGQFRLLARVEYAQTAICLIANQGYFLTHTGHSMGAPVACPGPVTRGHRGPSN
jgi:hypothetical protein